MITDRERPDSRATRRYGTAPRSVFLGAKTKPYPEHGAADERWFKTDRPPGRSLGGKKFTVLKSREKLLCSAEASCGKEGWIRAKSRGVVFCIRALCSLLIAGYDLAFAIDSA